MPHKTVERIVLFVFLIGVIYFSIIYAYPRYDKPLVSMDYHIQHGNWEKVIDLQYDYRLETRYIVCATNRALYHTGELLKNMFSFPQKRGDVALFLNEKEDDYGPLFRSELFYELGFLDESLMCCYESISLNGETPWNLRQLALIRMANRDSLGAVEVLSKLKQTFLFWDWARHYSHVLESDSLFNADPVFTAKIPASEAPELEGFFDGPAEKLELMLKRDPDNRMVFEYLIAYYLFSWDFEKIVEHLPQFEPYIQFRLPRHIQEAMVMYNDRHPFSQDFFDGLRINKRLDARYNTYRKLLAIHRIKKVDAAKKMRNSFGHTFWYYTVFPPTETVDYQHLEKQVKQAIRKKEDLIDDLQDQVKQAVRNKNDLLKRLVKEYENRN